jgi:hypothetical protein
MKRTEISDADFAKAQATYCNMMADGKGVKAALEATGLSHSQGDWAWYGDPRNPQAVEPGSVELPPLPGKDDPGYEVALRRRGLVVGELRKGEHARYRGRELSFGQIAVVCGVPEGAVHRAFTATGISSHGTRKGRGGRWLSDEPRLYLGNRKGIGVESADPKRVNPKELEKDNDTVQSVLPARLQALRQQVGKRVAKKATAKRTQKRAQKRTPTTK